MSHVFADAHEPAPAPRRRLASSRVLQAQLAVRPPHDAFEREAERVAATVTRGGLTVDAPDETEMIGGLTIQRDSAGHVPAAPPAVERAVDGLRGGGRPLDAGVRRDFESRLGHDFGRVRVHTDERAAGAAQALSADAFAVGADIVFAPGRYSPSSTVGRRLLAHELTHVVQQSAAGPLAPAVQRDLAVEPPSPTAVAPVLTPAELAEAVRFNRFRFKDPWTIRIVRDVLCLAPVPALADEDLARAIAEWQAQHDLAPDGKAGAETTATIVAELSAEDQAKLATDVRRDNYVIANDVTAPTYRMDAPGTAWHFQWDVAFRTSLRNGWIIQQVDNEFVPAMCDATAYRGRRPTARYWEAWRVNAAGGVTPQVRGINDMWLRGFARRSSGRWTMRGRFFTVLRLPASFAVGGVADAGPILRSTAANPGGDVLGLEAGSRRIGGDCDFCPPTNTHTRR